MSSGAELDLEFERPKAIDSTLNVNIVTAPSDLGEEWRALKGFPAIPKFVYAPYEGYGLNSMYIWKLACHDCRRSAHHLPRGSFVWVANFMDLVYAGPKYDHHLRKPEHYHSNRMFTFLVKNTCLTLEGALDKIEEFRQKHLTILRDRRTQVLADIEEKKKWVRDFDQELKESTPITLGSLNIDLKEHLIGE